MAKQKIVVKVTFKNCKKSRKALQIAASFSGVDTVTLVDEEQIAVIGERIDSYELTCLLRKRVGDTKLVSVGPVAEKKPDKPTPAPAPSKETKEKVRYEYYVYPPHYCWNEVPLHVVHEVPYNPCSIL